MHGLAMLLRIKFLLLYVSIPFLLFTGCARGPTHNFSFFGDTYSFTPSTQNPDVLIYRHPVLSASDYSSFLIDPVEIYSKQYAGNRGISPDQKKVLAESFKEELIDNLKGYHIVEAVGPGVLRLRVRIRDIHPSHWEADENKFLALKFDTELESAAMELECLDSMSGVTVIALIHDLKGRMYREENNVKRLGNIRDAFSAWAKSLRQRLDEAKSKKEINRSPESGISDSNNHQKIRLEEGE